VKFDSANLPSEGCDCGRSGRARDGAREWVLPQRDSTRFEITVGRCNASYHPGEDEALKQGTAQSTAGSKRALEEEKRWTEVLHIIVVKFRAASARASWSRPSST
jgi:hypothetical protein